jgi:hypothetical protein
MIKKVGNLIMSLDVRNTLYGGRSEPYFSLHKLAERHEVHARVPGINSTALKVEIDRNLLSIFYHIPINSLGKIVHMPMVIYSNSIPDFIEIHSIKILYGETGIIIQLPFFDGRH